MSYEFSFRKAARAVTLAALLLATGAAISARSAEQDTVSVRVGYSDLDLSTDAGSAELKRRIMKAAQNVCQQVEDGSSGSLTDLQACRNETFASAMVDAKVRIAAAHQSSTYAGNTPR